MVKFSFATILTSTLAKFASAGTPSRTIKLSDRTFRRGDASTEALLQKARPYKRKAGSRHLANDDGFQLDSSYSIKFSQCVDVKLLDNYLFAEDFVYYTKSGQLVSTKSFVLFHVCQGDNCFYESEQDLYIVDLPTYVTNVALYYAYERNTYCAACLNYEASCNAGDDAAADDAAAAGDDAVEEAAGDDAAADAQAGDDAAAAEEEVAADDAVEADDFYDMADDAAARRNLKKAQRRTKKAVDCDQCAAYNCFEELDDDATMTQKAIDIEVATWITSLAGCQKTGEQWQGEDFHVGLMCSAYGDGVELAVFLDEECTVYTSTKAFDDVYNSYYYTYNYNQNYEDHVTLAKTYIQNAFSETMSCRAEEYVAPGYGTDDDAYQYGVNDYCQNIFDAGALDFGTCYANQYMQQDLDDQYNWYEFDMTYDDSEDLDDVCSAVKTMDGEYYHSYDEEHSGTWYERDSSGKIKKKSSKNFDGSLAGKIIGYIVLGIVVIGVVSYVIRNQRRRAKRNQPLYQGGAMI